MTKPVDENGIAIWPYYFKCSRTLNLNCRHTMQTKPGPCMSCGSPTFLWRQLSD